MLHSYTPTNGTNQKKWMKHHLQRLNQKENLNKYYKYWNWVSNQKTPNKSLGSDSSLGEILPNTLKKKLISILLKLFPKKWRGGNTFNSLRLPFSLMPKPDKSTTKKENYQSMSLINIVTKVLKNIRKIYSTIYKKDHTPWSVQFSLSVMFDSLRPHESQHARPPCLSPIPRVYSNSWSSEV